MSTSAWQYYKDFLSWDTSRQYSELLNQSSQHWHDAGAAKALEVFHEASQRVPAYRDFLEKHAVRPELITTIDDFRSHVPTINKHNYLKHYPLRDLCWDGNLDPMHVISVSSGSTGKPFMWPREEWQEREVDFIYNTVFDQVFRVPEKRSLVLICFAIGMYIAGPFTYASCLRYGEKGRPLAITCPSNNIEAAVRIIQELAGEFDQIIIGGYPPLVKDVLEAASQNGINLHDKPVKLFFGGEGFSENWRNYVHQLIGSSELFTTTVNMYGTADAALLGFETPTSIAFRRIAASDMEFRVSHFHSELLPSVLTYNPLMKYFEELEDHTLLFTSSSGIPTIRYEIGDHGGIISHDHLALAMSEHGDNLEETLDEFGVSHINWKLPLVYLFGRKDFTVQLYGANVYPENVKEALELPFFRGKLTGKFVLTTENREDMSPYLHLRVQAEPGIEKSSELAHQIAYRVSEYIRSVNSEYKYIFETIGEKAIPEIQIDSHSNPDYQINIKHRWTQR